jgi:RNA-directed DNA polymerase
MMRCLKERISDLAFLRIIWKMLKAGVMEENRLNPTDMGTPQGGIISPVLSNIYLHYVLDLWMQARETKKLQGYARLIRYADDFIVGVQYKFEAQMIHQDIGERLKKFGLTLSAEKTKILAFGRFIQPSERRKRRKPQTFTFLGITHYCGKTRDGRFSLKVKTSSRKLHKAITAMKIFLKNKRTTPLPDVLNEVALKLTGHYNYYGVSGNIKGLSKFHHETKQLLYKWMSRRSQKRSFNWDEFSRYLTYNPLPKPKLTYALYNFTYASNGERFPS